MTVFAITWRYHDGSASGLVDVFSEREQTERVMQILREHGDGMKAFLIDEVSL